jgi:hypothetical protein
MLKQGVHFQYHEILNKQHHQKHKVIQGRLTSIAQTMELLIKMWRHAERRSRP